MAVYIPDTGNLDLNLALEQLANNVTTTVAQTMGGNVVTIDSGNAIVTPSGGIVGYVNRYMWVTFADNGFGGGNSPVDTNKSFYGILNTNDNLTVPNNFLNFSYTQIAGGFGTTRNLYYKTTGGRSIDWDVNTAPQNNEWLPVNVGNMYVAIDLDQITSVSGGGNGISTFASVIYQANNTQPVAPIGGSYTFANNVLIPPVGWSPNIPNVVNQNIYGATFTFNTATPITPVVAGTWAVSNVVYREGQSATSTYQFPVYIRQSTQPNTPVANTGYYDFSTGSGGVPNGSPITEVWNLTPPAGADQLYVSYTTAAAIGQGNANMLMWSYPAQVSSVGANGANGNTSVVASVYQANASAPLAISTDGYYNFSTASLTPPAGWSNAIPSNSGLPIWISQATFITNNPAANIANTTPWSSPSLAFQGGGAGPAGSRGIIPMAFVLTNTDPTSYSNAQYTSAFSSSRTSPVPPVGTGYAPISGDTAQFYFANNANRQNDVAVVRSYDGTGWANAVGQVIGGNLIVTGSINSAQLNTNSLYAIRIRGGGVQNVTDTANVGYFLDAPSGDALFTGNVRIGDKLAVGNNAIFGNSVVIGANLFVGANANIGANIRIGDNAIIGNNLSVGANLQLGDNLTIGNNLVVGNNATIFGVIVNGAIAPNAVVTTNIVSNSITNSRTFIDDPAVNQVIYNNGNPNWANNTRGIGVSGVFMPQTNSSSGSRIEIDFLTYVRTIPNASATLSTQNDQANSGLIEIWKTGGGNYYAQNYTSVSSSLINKDTTNNTFTRTAFASSNSGAAYYFNGSTWTQQTLPANVQSQRWTKTVSVNGNISGNIVTAGLYTSTADANNRYPQATTLQDFQSSVNWSVFVNASTINPVSDITLLPQTAGVCLYVGSSGTIFTDTIANGNPSTYGGGYTQQSSGTIENLNAVDVNTNPANPSYSGATTNPFTYTIIAVGNNGVITRGQRSSTATYNSATTFTLQSSNTFNSLRDVCCQYAKNFLSFANAVPLSNNWAAVGDSGTIVYSDNNGTTWYAATSGTTSNLHGIANDYNGNSLMVAVGENGTILTSTNSGQTWAQISQSTTTRHLWSVDGHLNGNFYIGSQDAIYVYTPSTGVVGTIFENSPAASGNLTRLWYSGSFANTFQTGTPPPEAQIQNGQILSGKIIDQDYQANVATTYYMVLGNDSGDANCRVYTGGPVLTVTEIKR